MTDAARPALAAAPAVPIRGRCLCGAVRVTVRAALGDMSACHCDNCRRWGGGLQIGMDAPAAAVTVEGPVKTHRSSAIAERAWCDTCGSALWLRDVTEDGSAPFELCPGLFDGAGGATLAREVYADRAAGGLTFAGAHPRVSARDYERDNPSL